MNSMWIVAFLLLGSASPYMEEAFAPGDIPPPRTARKERTAEDGGKGISEDGARSSADAARKAFERDVIKTAKGNLEITFIGHGTLMFRYGGKVIHVDPVGRYADYGKMPPADLVLITHEHGDHLDPEALKKIVHAETEVVFTKACLERLEKAAGEREGEGLGKAPVLPGTLRLVKNGDRLTAAGFPIEAVPAYNVKHLRRGGEPYHPRGAGNGYVIRFSDRKVYVAGDTENISEMKALKDIHVAFLPMNLPYTMTPEMVADAARSFRPRILYPYHFGDTDTDKILKLLAEERGIEVRIRKLR